MGKFEVAAVIRRKDINYTGLHLHRAAAAPSVEYLEDRVLQKISPSKAVTGLLASHLGTCENVTQTGIFADAIPSCLFLVVWVGGFFSLVWVLVVFL